MNETATPGEPEGAGFGAAKFMVHSAFSIDALACDLSARN
jgi:hypothetical protein